MTSPRLPEDTYKIIEEKLALMAEELGIEETELNRRSKLPNGLTIKQLIFCEAYLANGGNSYEASVVAGYKAKVKDGNYGQVLLKKPEVSKYIMDKMQSKLKVRNISSDDVLAELINVAMFNIKDAVSWDKNSVTYKSSDEIPDSVASCIKSVNEIKIAGGHKMVRVEFHDKMKALDTITKLMGLHQDTILHKHVNVNDESEVTAEELEADLKRAGLLGHLEQPIIEVEEQQSPKVYESVQRVESIKETIEPTIQEEPEPEQPSDDEPKELSAEEKWALVPKHLKNRGSWKPRD